MNRIINYILLSFLLLLSSCDYKPVLTNKNYSFSVNIVKKDGDQKINSEISNNLNYLKGKEIKYDLTLSSNKEKNILSKDTKGDPSIFEIIINVNYSVKKDNNILITNKINRKTTYNNITDKFDLENYEKSITDNLTKSISDKIIFSISEIHE
tara:strand:- start:674 stop:1132 length:459 start_codon:yes stop_codon:yes gene_type:complete